MGVSWNEFWGMNPRIIKLIAKGYQEKIKEQDYIAWWANQYTLSAVMVAVEHCLAGTKAKSKYIEKPFLQEIEEKQMANKELTEEEKKRQTEQLFTQLQIMQANFKLNKKKGE